MGDVDVCDELDVSGGGVCDELLGDGGVCDEHDVDGGVCDELDVDGGDGCDEPVDDENVSA